MESIEKTQLNKNEDSLVKEKEYMNPKEEAAQEMKNANKEFNDSFKKMLDESQLELIHDINNNISPVEQKEHVVNIMGKLREFTTGNALRRIITAAAAYGMYFGVGTHEVRSENIDVNSETEKNLNFDKNNSTHDPETFFFEGDSEKKLRTFESNIGFDLAKTNISESDLEKFNRGVEEYLSSFNDTELEKIKHGEMLLLFEAGSSPEIITSTIETSMGEVHDNFDLSQKRAEIFKAKVLEKLAEKGINNPVTTTKIPVIEGKEPGVSESGERFASVTALEMSYENMVKYMDILIVDSSGSMKNDIEFINSLVSETSSETEIVDVKTRKKGGETLEFYLETISSVVLNAEKGSNIFMVGDEMDDFGRMSSFSSEDDRVKAFKKVFKKVQEIATEKGINVLMKRINPENPNESIIDNYFDSGLNMFSGKNDQQSYNRHKSYLENKK